MENQSRASEIWRNARPPAAGASAHADTLSDSQIDALAHRRTAMQLGWLTHAGVYLCVNLAVGLASMVAGRHWPVFPFLGWGLGLLAHGVAVLLAGPRADLYQRLLDRELLRLQPRRDPW